jgi:hypothetical protein
MKPSFDWKAARLHDRGKQTDLLMVFFWFNAKEKCLQNPEPAG